MEEMFKKCFKCGLLLPITEFYAHPQMGDGHLNKRIKALVDKT